MTFRELAEAIKDFTEEQLNSTVTVYVPHTEEFYSVVSDYPLVFTDPDVNDVLDPNHPYLVI